MAQRRSGPRRFRICGIPFTYELLLRIFIMLATIGLLVVVVIPKIKSILDQVNYVSVKITNSLEIPVPDILICGELLDTVELDIVSKTQYSDGTTGPDQKRAVPKEYYTIKNATEFHLQGNGDWGMHGKCVYLKRQDDLVFPKNLEATDEPALVKVVFAVTAKQPYLSESPAGVSIAIWNGDIDVTKLQPIWGAIPSINTLTFVYSEHIPLVGPPQRRYTLQKQNLRPTAFSAKQIIAKVEISPDSFYINQYIDKRGYTWVDLAGAIGGMASIALALWIFLFGSGRYKSWGVMQRYVLQTSPNSRRYRKDEAPPKNMFEAFQRWLKKQLRRLDSTADNDLDNMPLHPDPRRASLRYSTALNTAAVVAHGGKGGHGSNNNNSNNNNFSGSHSNRSSVDFGNYYFSEHGAPGSLSLQPLAPLNDNEEYSEEQEVEELIRLIDLRIDERMWSLERTLSRYYLDGFRLRNYSSSYSMEARALAAAGSMEDGLMMTKEEEANNDRSPPGSSDQNSRMELLDGDYTPPMSTPPVPAYPPRPQVNQHYAYLGDSQQAQQQASHSPAGPTAPQIHVGEAPRSTKSEIEQTSSQPPTEAGPVRHLPSAADGSAFMLDLPQRSNMRGTIRKAVERLQHEWPQSQAQDVYVPRTQYGSPTAGNNNNNSTSGNAGNYGGYAGNYGGYGNSNPAQGQGQGEEQGLSGSQSNQHQQYNPQGWP
ncbi:hypothetical protein BGW39_011197 [Mortierella sp. 14UC]|nr:hypothetical protein BGW39_011197 [Mortierella sp. 14UC]